MESELTQDDVAAIVKWVDDNYVKESHNPWDFAYKAAEWAIKQYKPKWGSLGTGTITDSEDLTKYLNDQV